MTQIKLRRDTAANFTSKNPVLGVGEPAYETDTKKLKIGDGTTAYTQLEYFSAGGGGSTPANMVTTDTAQTITGAKTFDKIVFKNGLENGIFINDLTEPSFYVTTDAFHLKRVGELTGDGGNLVLGSNNDNTIIYGSTVIDKNRKKFLVQGSITAGSDNLEISDTLGGVEIICNAPTNTQFKTLQDTVAGKAAIANVWTLSTVGNTSTPLSWGASGSKYTAPANGRFFVEALSADTNKYVRLYCNKNSINRLAFGNGSGVMTVDISVDAGDEVALFHNLSESPSIFKFVYANGG